MNHHLAACGPVAVVLLAGCWTTDLPDRQRPAVLTVQDLGSIGIDIPVSSGKETFSRTRIVDGASLIEYEFTQDAESAQLYLSVTIDVDRNVRDARLTATGNKALVKGMLWLEKVQVREDAGFAYGDQSYFGTLLQDSSPIGSWVVARQGLIVYTVVMGGFVVDSSDWRRLLDAKFAHADSLFPAKQRRVS